MSLGTCKNCMDGRHDLHEMIFDTLSETYADDSAGDGICTCIVCDDRWERYVLGRSSPDKSVEE